MRRIILCLAVPLILCLGVGAAFPDHGGNGRKRQRYQEGRGEHRVPPVANLQYRQQCGECHMAYQPALLPAASWQAILAKLPEHFGEQVEVTATDRSALQGYLAANAAESCGCKISGKILKNLGGQVPLRITETSYFRHKHDGHDIPAGAFERKAVGSRGNCRACHPTAEQGCYNEDLVRIPR